MAEQVEMSGPAPVSDDAVWRYTKGIFIVSALIFLVTIALGFLNVFTKGGLPRWQLLTHLHSGTLGWLTLSAFGATVWLFTADRPVSDTYVRWVRWLAVSMVVAFIGLIVSFAIAFSQGGGSFDLLAVFAPIAALTIWAAAVFFLRQLARLAVVTTAHLLTGVAFLILGVAVIFANVVALGRAGIVSPPDFALTAHVFGILGFEVLAVTGLIEWLVRRERGRWSRAGALQVGLGVLLGLWVPLLVLLLVAGVPEEALSMVVLVGLVGGLILFGLVFLARTGRQALSANPLAAGEEAWVFFATLWFVVGMLSFPLRFALGDPSWWITANTHVVFIGIVTNLLLGVFAVRTRSASVGYTWAQPAAMWLMNGGLVVFIALLIATGSKHGALVMGTGALLGVGWMLFSLRETPADAGTAVDTGVETTD